MNIPDALIHHSSQEIGEILRMLSGPHIPFPPLELAEGCTAEDIPNGDPRGAITGEMIPSGDPRGAITIEK